MRIRVAPSMIADGVIHLRTDGVSRRHREDGIVRQFASAINQRKFLSLDVVPFMNRTDEIAA